MSIDQANTNIGPKSRCKDNPEIVLVYNSIATEALQILYGIKLHILIECRPQTKLEGNISQTRLDWLEY